MHTSPDSASVAPLTARQKWIAAAVALVVLLVVFRQQLANHFTLLSGERIDGVIAVALL